MDRNFKLPYVARIFPQGSPQQMSDKKYMPFTCLSALEAEIRNPESRIRLSDYRADGIVHAAMGLILRRQLRFVLWALTRTLYRIRTPPEERRHVPFFAG
jgi:hypothetical protein